MVALADNDMRMVIHVDMQIKLVRLVKLVEGPQTFEDKYTKAFTPKEFDTALVPWLISLGLEQEDAEDIVLQIAKVILKAFVVKCIME